MVRFAVIGRGKIVEQFLRHAALCPEFRLVACYSRSMADARRFAQDHGAQLWFDDLARLAACSEVDAVYIASPTAFHAQQSVAMLQGGKHVLCEKPATANAAQLRWVLAEAQKAQRVFLEAMKPVFEPGFETIRQALPRLGAIRRVSAHYCQYSSRYDDYRAGVVRNAFLPQLANGALMDLGCYLIHPLIALFGPPQRLQAGAVMLESGVDAETMVLLQYPQMIACCTASKVEDSHTDCEIAGEDGTLAISGFNEPDRVTLYPRGGAAQPLPVGQLAENMLYELQAFLQIIAGRLDSAPYRQWSLQAREAVDEARRQIGLQFEADRTGPAGPV